LDVSEVEVVAQAPGGPVVEDSRGAQATETLGFSRPHEWQERLKGIMADGHVPLHLVGAGNRLRADDAAGLEIVYELRSRLGAAPTRGIRIHPVSVMPERILTKISSKRGRIMVFDAVEASKEPGEVVLCRMAETRYGFFVTHNVPLKLIPGLSAREDDVYLVGIQPASLDVGEGLTDRVSRSVREVVAIVTEGVLGRS
jgi:hydrogenase maturation protease